MRRLALCVVKLTIMSLGAAHSVGADEVTGSEWHLHLLRHQIENQAVRIFITSLSYAAESYDVTSRILFHFVAALFQLTHSCLQFANFRVFLLETVLARPLNNFATLSVVSGPAASSEAITISRASISMAALLVGVSGRSRC